MPPILFLTGEGDTQDNGKRKVVKPKKVTKKQVTLAERTKRSCNSLEELAPPGFEERIDDRNENWTQTSVRVRGPGVMSWMDS